MCIILIIKYNITTEEEEIHKNQEENYIQSACPRNSGFLLWHSPHDIHYCTLDGSQDTRTLPETFFSSKVFAVATEDLMDHPPKP